MKQQLALEGRFPDIEVCRDVLVTLLDSYPATVILLDALDECEESSRHELMEVMDYLMVKTRRPLKILVSSRPNEDIKDHFRTHPFIEIQATDNQNDIEDFVRDKISQDKHLKALSAGLKRAIMDTLFKESKGMFQWTALQIAQMQELAKPSWTTEERILERLGKLPDSLDATYHEIWERIRQKPSGGNAFAERAFQWILCSYKPLTTEQLVITMMLDPDSDSEDNLQLELTEEAINDLSGGLLKLERVSTSHCVWRFSHLSVREYLEKHHFRSSQPHLFVGMACLKYMTTSASDARQLWSSALSPGNTAMWTKHTNPNYCRQRHSAMIDPTKDLCDYFQHNWHLHVMMREGSQVLENERLQILLKRFLGSVRGSSEAYQSWVQRMDLPHSRIRSTRKRLLPSSSPVFGMSAFGFFHLLRDWWEDSDLDLNLCNASGTSLLSLAIEADSPSVWRFLLQREVELENGTPLPLAQAFASNSNPAVEVLLQKGAKVNPLVSGVPPTIRQLSDLWKTIPLLAAIAQSNDSSSSLQLMLKAGAKVNFETPGGTPLEYALAHEKWDVVDALLNSGAEIRRPTKCLLHAASGGHCNFIKLFLDHGADVNACKGNKSALSVAAFNNREKAVELLLSSGADVDLIVGPEQTTALIAAVEGLPAAFQRVHGRYFGPSSPTKFMSDDTRLAVDPKSPGLAVINSLLASGVNVNKVVDRNTGSTALVAATHQLSMGVIRFLIDVGADPNAGSGYNRPIFAAIYNKDVQVLRFLLEVGADANVVASGLTPLCLALEGRNADRMVTLLLEFNANPNFGTGHDRSLVLTAKRSYELFGKLTNMGADLNVAALHTTPLLAAIQLGELRCAYFLMKAGACCRHATSRPLYEAAVQDNALMLRLLLESGAGFSLNDSELAFLAGTIPLPEALNFLLDKGFGDGLSFDAGWGKALALAAFFGELTNSALLLNPKWGINMNTCLPYGYKNAIYAAMDGHRSMIGSRKFVPEMSEMGDDTYRIEHAEAVRVVTEDSDDNDDDDDIDEDTSDEEDSVSEDSDWIGIVPIRRTVTNYAVMERGVLVVTLRRNDMAHQSLIDLLLSQGVEIPMPLYLSLEPLLVPVQMNDRKHFRIDAIQQVQIRGAGVVFSPFPREWGQVMWEIESGTGPHRPLRVQLRDCGFSQGFPSWLTIFMRLNPDSVSKKVRYAAILLCRDASHRFVLKRCTRQPKKRGAARQYKWIRVGGIYPTLQSKQTGLLNGISHRGVSVSLDSLEDKPSRAYQPSEATDASTAVEDPLNSVKSPHQKAGQRNGPPLVPENNTRFAHAVRDRGSLIYSTKRHCVLALVVALIGWLWFST